jgi:hypothetical protein
MDRALALQRGEPIQIHIRGLDELRFTPQSLMVESCNCSFQIHFQVDPADFPLAYNAAQAFTAPVLAVAANAPVLLGRRLWHESRIALFQQSTDTRTMGTERESVARVTFGRRWVERSILEIYREDLARFRPIFGVEDPEDPFEAMRRNEAPKLEALRIHNGTVWRWNRPCYGTLDGCSLHRESHASGGPSLPSTEMANTRSGSASCERRSPSGSTSRNSWLRARPATSSRPRAESLGAAYVAQGRVRSSLLRGRSVGTREPRRPTRTTPAISST